MGGLGYVINYNRSFSQRAKKEGYIKRLWLVCVLYGSGEVSINLALSPRTLPPLWAAEHNNEPVSKHRPFSKYFAHTVAYTNGFAFRKRSFVHNSTDTGSVCFQANNALFGKRQRIWDNRINGLCLDNNYCLRYKRQPRLYWFVYLAFNGTAKFVKLAHFSGIVFRKEPVPNWQLHSTKVCANFAHETKQRAFSLTHVPPNRMYPLSVQHSFWEPWHTRCTN